MKIILGSPFNFVVSNTKIQASFFFVHCPGKQSVPTATLLRAQTIGPFRGFHWRSASHQRSPLQSCFVPGPFEDFPSFYGEETLACFPRCALISPPLKCTHLFFRSLFRPRSMLGYIGDSCRAGFLFSGLNKRVRPASNTHYTTFSFAPSALLPHTFSMEYEFRLWLLRVVHWIRPKTAGRLLP